MWVGIENSRSLVWPVISVQAICQPGNVVQDFEVVLPAFDEHGDASDGR